MSDWRRITWPESALVEGIQALIRRLNPSARAVQADPLAFGRNITPGDLIERTAANMGHEAEPVVCEFGELQHALAVLGPAVVRMRIDEEARYLLIVSSGRHRVVALTPTLVTAKLKTASLHRRLEERLASAPRRRIDEWLARSGVSPRRARAAHAQLLMMTIGQETVGDIWLLNTDPGRGVWKQLVRVGARGTLAWVGGLTIAQVTVATLAWMLITRGSLSGRFELEWFIAFALAYLTACVLQLVASHAGGRLLNDCAAALKRRLLCGALRIEPDSVRLRGSGRLLAMVSESEVFESFGLSGVFAATLASFQLAGAAVLFALGQDTALHLMLLVVWCLLTLAAARQYHRRRARWTELRFDLANTFMENVVGHRTRACQRERALWHLTEDAMLEEYLQISRQLDAAHSSMAIIGRSWLALALVGLVPALLRGAEPATLAIALGGTLQAYSALSTLVRNAGPIAAASVAWRQISELYGAAAAVPQPGHIVLSNDAPSGVSEALLDMRAVTFRYMPAAEPVLSRCDFTLRRGEHVLLQGASGGGKSTLAALLVGLRIPQAGHVLLRGLDSTTLGQAAWRRHVTSAPQFHENHIFAGTLAFNLLMGREWPPDPLDLKEAEALCRELGLGTTLDRMPSGIHQVIGESGWQLSHGERSRLFLARALLQRADVVVLDESFGALDPATLRTCLTTVKRRAPSLIVIAHV